MAQLSEWLQIMLGEIARKQDEAQQAADEMGRRSDANAQAPRPSTPYLSTASGRPSPQSG
jgi:hypothetical protein